MTEISNKKLHNSKEVSPSNHNLREYSVSEISGALKTTIEQTYTRVRIRGEVSGFKQATSGHLYFSLKDENAVLDSVCWKNTATRLSIFPEDGLEIIATGRITTFSGRSKYQIIIESIELAGEGALLKLLEDRKKKLKLEGLFDQQRKKSPPFLPEVIGIITSPTGAVFSDMMHRLSERFPRHVLLWPVHVQGDGAAQEVEAAIRGFNKFFVSETLPKPDIIIVARGGGSLEDLWAFNEENVVRAAADSIIPLVSAIGHETDWTLIDLAADIRAPTPSAAAEIAVPVRTAVLADIQGHEERLVNAIRKYTELISREIRGLSRGIPQPRRRLEESSQNLDNLSERLVSGFKQEMNYRGEKLNLSVPKPQRLLDYNKERLSSDSRGLNVAIGNALDKLVHTLYHLQQLMESYSHHRVLERGYALVFDEKNRPISSGSILKPNQKIEIMFRDSTVPATIKKQKLFLKKTSKNNDDEPQGQLI